MERRLWIRFLLFLGWGLTLQSKSTLSLLRAYSRSDPNADSSDDSFEIAQLLRRSCSPRDPLCEYDVGDIARAVHGLTVAQSAWKSMDAATHRLRNAVKESSSLNLRYRKFCESNSRNRKEAGKLLEYIETVERGMQAAEILQAVATKNAGRRTLLLGKAGAEEVFRRDLQVDKLSVCMTVVRPSSVDDSPFSPHLAEHTNQSSSKEMFIVLTDSSSSTSVTAHEYLKQLRSRPARSWSASLGGSSATHQAVVDLCLVPAIVNLSRQALLALQEHVNSSQVSHVRIVGHSFGGAVAAYLALALDGASLQDSSSNPFHFENATYSWAGNFHGKVQGLLLGPPPCMSRAIVPRFVASIVCDDDVVCRLESDAWRTFHERVLRALQAGAGKKGLSWIAAPHLAKDMGAQAKRYMASYRSAKRNASALRLPGRVFFIKSRAFKGGATLQRVCRGNWQEDMLWGLHHIVLGRKMLQHHSVDAYIRTLNRL